MIVFETARLRVRHYTIGDLESFYQLNSNAEVMQYIRPVKNRPETDVFLRKIIEDTNKDSLLGRWAVDEKKSRTTIGTFVIIPVDHSDKMQLGYALLQDAWGKGYATELVDAGLSYLAEKKLMPEIYGMTELGNISSQKVLIKAGFQRMENVLSAGIEVAQFIFRLPEEKKHSRLIGL